MAGWPFALLAVSALLVAGCSQPPETPTADANNNITPGSPRAFRVSITGNL